MPTMTPPVRVRCYRKTKNREAPPLNNVLIPDMLAAVERGKRFLDDPEEGGYYFCVFRSLKIPHREGVAPGKWITVTDRKLGLKQTPLKILSYKLTIGADGQIWGNAETIEYQERE